MRIKTQILPPPKGSRFPCLIIMKYPHKCAYCSKKADEKWRGQYFCNDHKKFMRRHKVESFMGKERIVGVIDKFRIYCDIPVYLK